MRIYVVDDEPIALRGSIKTIQEVVPDAEITGFGRANNVLRKIEEIRDASKDPETEYPDVVFSDIEMPGISGLDFVIRLRQLCAKTKIIFVTAYSQYALDAFRLHVHGYILKPITADRVREELLHALPESAGELEIEAGDQSGMDDRGGADSRSGGADSRGSGADSRGSGEELLKVQCFGYFEVFRKDEPLMFGRRQTKELLAYLIDRMGASCTSEEIAAAMWEDETNMKNMKARIRILISDLRQTFARYGLEDVLIRRSGQIAIRKDRVDCDYYRMLEGDVDAVNAYQGEYMVQYSWAEMTAGRLAFRGLSS